jgi:hypothetical protein
MLFYQAMAELAEIQLNNPKIQLLFDAPIVRIGDNEKCAEENKVLSYYIYIWLSFMGYNEERVKEQLLTGVLALLSARERRTGAESQPVKATDIIGSLALNTP